MHIKARALAARALFPLPAARRSAAATPDPSTPSATGQDLGNLHPQRQVPACSGEIGSAVPAVHGENAHSAYLSRDAFEELKGGNKELLIIPGAFCLHGRRRCASAPGRFGPSCFYQAELDAFLP